MADRTSDPAEEPADGDGGEGAGTTERADDSGSGGRPDSAESPDGDVVVPLRLYKTVTVFSTLIAIVAILAGFVLLDKGTQRATASPEEVSLPLVALGLALIVGGSAVYAFSTRFRTAGMGKSKDDTDEGSDDG
jgi:hypothetical protein